MAKGRALARGCSLYGDSIPGRVLADRLASYVHLFNLYWYSRCAAPARPCRGGAVPWAAHVRPAQRRSACAAQSRGLLRCKAARRAPALGRMRLRSPSEVGFLTHVLCELNMLFRRRTLAVSTSPFLWRGVSWHTAYAAVCWRWAARRGQRAALTCCSPSTWCAHYLCMSGNAGVAVPADHTAQRRCWPCTMTMARSCTW